MMKSKRFRFTVRVLLSVVLLMLALSSIGGSAQPAADDSAHIIVFNNLEGREPALDIWLDDKVLVQDVTTVSYVIERTVAPGDYTLTATEYGTGIDAPMFAPIQATLEAGNLYVLFAGGALVLNKGNAFLDLIPLGQSLAPGETAPGRIVAANHVDGLPAVDLLLDGQVVATDIPSGQTAISDAPMDQFVHETWSDPQTGKAILEQHGLEPPAEIFDNTLTVFIMRGKYPGEAHESYESWLLPPIYVGAVTTTEGAEIHVGDEVALELEAGQRIRYPLTLDKDTNVDIRLRGATESQDAYLRLYDAAGSLLGENDELSYSDETYDAGLTELMLKAGTYLVEAGSWGEVFPGSFTLSVK